MDFGTRLRSWRIDANLSQRELARRADLNFSYLSKIEAGLVPPPSEDKIHALVAATGRSEDDATSLLALAHESRIPNEVVKAALIRNPGVGALLRADRCSEIFGKGTNMEDGNIIIRYQKSGTRGWTRFYRGFNDCWNQTGHNNFLIQVDNNGRIWDSYVNGDLIRKY